MSSHRASAVKRLLHDLKEVLQQPLPDVAARPLEDDLFLWHGNVRGAIDSQFTDVPFHFILVFPDDYPRTPPTVGLYTRMPHPNILRWTGPKARTEFRLALWDCNPQENQWSSAYTVHSMLIQIQAFLIAEEMMWKLSPVSLDQAIRAASRLGPLKDSGHSGSDPWPVFATELEIQAASERAKAVKLVVQKPQHNKIRTGALWTPPPTPQPKKAKPFASAVVASQQEAEESKEEAASPPQAPSKDTEVWMEVKSSKKRKSPPSSTSPTLSLQTQKEPQPNSSNYYANLNKKNMVMLEKKAKAKGATPLQAPDVPPTPSPAKPVQATKSSKKNAARAKKRAAKHDPPQESSASDSPASSPSPSPAASESSNLDNSPVQAAEMQPRPSSKSESEWQKIPEKPKKVEPKEGEQSGVDLATAPHSELIQSVEEEVMQSVMEPAEPIDGERDAEMGLDSGLFTDLPTDILNNILLLVSRKDIASLAASCKGLRACCGDGEVWKMLLERDFANTQITASRSSDWRHAYMLQASNIVGNLQCFHSKASFEDEVLGMPLYFTVNPRKKSIDYIAVGIDLLSVSAFKQGVTRAATKSDLSGQSVLEVCPVYLNEAHFQRALPHLHTVLKKLNPDIPPQQLRPAHWLDTCAKMLNTCVLLLIDKGMEASQKAIHVYCQVHRLMLALAEHYKLWDEAVKRLDAFLKYPSKRDKSTCPNLGLLIALLAVSPKHSWKDINIAVMLESFDRAVIWACKAQESLIERYKKPESARGEDKELLDGVFESTRVSRGILAFHAAFMRNVARPSNIPLEKVMDQSDTLYGFASDGQIKCMQNVVRRCQEIKSWEDFFLLIGSQPNLRGQTFVSMMTGQLRRSWQNSLKKGYHKKDTDFSKIQASGVSSILLKGQSYTAPPNVRSLHVEDHWRCQEIRYLDLSLISYSFKGDVIHATDWSNTRSMGTQIIGAVTHSSDIYHEVTADSVGRSISQIADIHLDQLGKHVKEIFLTGSGFSGGTLADIMQPTIILTDSKTGAELCEYHLEEYSREVLRQTKCVVMCRVYRESAEGSWKVEAIGELLPHGYTMEYGPIFEYIAKRQGYPASTYTRQRYHYYDSD